MSLVLLAAPAVEPVTLAEAKAHLRIDGTAEDAFISSLIVTSRLHIEAALGLALITQSWAWTIDAWPKHASVELPMRPVQSIESVKIKAAGGAIMTLEDWRYVLDGSSALSRLLPTATRFPEPGAIAQGIEIRFTAGFGAAASATPAAIRQALLLLIAHWFENREPMSTDTPKRIPDTVSELLAPYRVVRL